MNGRFYLYGRGDAALAEILRAPAFTQLVNHLFAGATTRPSNDAERRVAAQAERLGLFALRGQELTPGPRLVVVPQTATQEAIQRMASALRCYGELASAAASELRRAYENTAAAGSWAWSRAEHAIVAGMLLDLSVGSRLWLDGHVRRAYDETLVWAFADPVGNNPFGVCWTAAAGESAGLAQLWHGAVERSDLRISREAVLALVQLVWGGHPLAPPERLLLRYLQLIAGSEADRPALVCFSADDMEQCLLPVLWRSAEQLVAAAVLPALAAASGPGSWWQGRTGDTYRHALVRMVLDLGIDQAVAAGALTAFPTGRVGAHWGRWLWLERTGARTLVAGAFSHS